MTNIDKNIRTLIVCFVLAMLALVPLRMMGNGQVTESKVLGESQEYYDEGMGEVIETDEGVVLPNAEL